MDDWGSAPVAQGADPGIFLHGDQVAGKAVWIARAERLFDQIPTDLRQIVIIFLCEQFHLGTSCSAMHTPSDDVHQPTHTPMHTPMHTYDEDVHRKKGGPLDGGFPKDLPVLQLPETQAKASTKPQTKDRYAVVPGFVNFWKIYPMHIGKGAAFDVWKKKNLEKISNIIIDALKERRGFRELEGGDYPLPNPRTWLHQERWEDDPPKPKGPEWHPGRHER